MPNLRKYQHEAKIAVAKSYRDGLRRVGISLPTGVGKTVIFSSIAYDVWANGKRVSILVHLDALVQQTVNKLLDAGIPAEAIGIVKAERNQVHAPVIVASIQTLANLNRLEQIIPPHLTIVDEAHMSAAPRYLAYFHHVNAVPGGLGYLVGLTATWMRHDRAGLGDIWEKVVYKKSIKWAVRNGFLVPPEGIQLGGNLDMSNVRTIKNPESENYGDYNTRDLQELVMVNDLRDTVVKGYQQFGDGQPAVLFAPTQASARYFLDAFNDAGIQAGEIMAGTTKATRAWNFASFDAGTMRVLGTCTALAVGWDSPRCAVALMVRPTRSPLLFIQSVGRILRPWPGKTCGRILDFVGVLDDATLASTVQLDKTPEETIPDYPCPECGRGLCMECTGCPSLRCDYFTCTCDDDQDEFERVPIPRTAKKIDGVHQVDLFAGTNARWLQTNRGIPFVTTEKHTYFIGQHEDAYAVGRCGANASKCVCHGPGRWILPGLSSEDALEQGSEIALEEDSSIADKRASWRQGRQEPTDGQIRMARGKGINPEGLSKSELSDQIAIKIASGLLARVGA